MVDLSTLSPGKRKKRKRVGRGPASGSGKTCGRGHKGQRSRSGYSRKPGFEGGQMPLHRRLPKRGFTHDQRHLLAEVNLDILDSAFEDGAEISPEAVFSKRIAKPAPGGIKILGRGETKKKFTVRTNSISASARTKIEGAGGTVEIIPPAEARAVARRGQTRSKKDAGDN